MQRRFLKQFSFNSFNLGKGKERQGELDSPDKYFEAKDPEDWIPGEESTSHAGMPNFLFLFCKGKNISKEIFKIFTRFCLNFKNIKENNIINFIHIMIIEKKI